MFDKACWSFDGTHGAFLASDEFAELGEEMRSPSIGRVHYRSGADGASVGRDCDPAICIAV